MEALCRALSRLSDPDLVKEVKRLAANERHAISELVASIAVLDERRAYVAEGYTSTHAWCVKVLGFSDDAAFYRITAARVVQSYPEVLEMLRTGALTLKAVRLLAPHLEEANHEELLAGAAHKSADEVAHLIAARKPRPDVPATIRKLPEPRSWQRTVCDLGATAQDPPAGDVAPGHLADPVDGDVLAVVAGNAPAATAPVSHPEGMSA
jgi:hypothetical protein